MNNIEINNGVFPTMITPYKKDGSIDYDATRQLTEFYIRNGCHGIFAVCQSSEMAFLSLDERVKLAKCVSDEANHRVSVVASGHCGNSIEEQVYEINAISETGIDAFVFASNRFDIHNDGDNVWLKNAERALSGIKPDISLGIYECPMPYKRLLTPKIIDWCIKTGRFKFIKDTCCDPDMLTQRLEQLNGSDCKLFNANIQTLLYSLKKGAAGYSGIMANFHPNLIVWLCENFEKQPEKAEMLSNVLSMCGFTEGPAYPCTAKYYLNKIGITMEESTRSSDVKRLNSYQKLIIEQLQSLVQECERETLKNY